MSRASALATSPDCSAAAFSTVPLPLYAVVMSVSSGSFVALGATTNLSRTAPTISRAPTPMRSHPERRISDLQNPTDMPVLSPMVVVLREGRFIPRGREPPELTLHT